MDHRGSFAIIVNSDNKILMMLRDDIPTIPSPNTWSLIGGSAESGETPLETVTREINEEVGLTITSNRLHFLFKAPSTQAPELLIYLFYVRISKNEEQMLKKGDEGQRIQFFDTDEIPTLALPPTIEHNFSKYKLLLEEIFAKGI